MFSAKTLSGKNSAAAMIKIIIKRNRIAIIVTLKDLLQVKITSVLFTQFY
jgi:hypothetical protein